MSLATSTRGVYEKLLEHALGHQRTLGSCLYGAVLCSVILNRFTNFRSVVRGGDGDSDGGLFIGDVGHGHYWVESTLGDDAFIVDITADQFGLAPVIVVPITHAPARYIPGDQHLVDGHAADLRREIELA